MCYSGDIPHTARKLEHPWHYSEALQLQGVHHSSPKRERFETITCPNCGVEMYVKGDNEPTIAQQGESMKGKFYSFDGVAPARSSQEGRILLEAWSKTSLYIVVLGKVEQPLYQPTEQREDTATSAIAKNGSHNISMRTIHTQKLVVSSSITFPFLNFI